MKLHLPNSAFLGNLDPFLRSFDPSDADKLKITANKKWISVHPFVLCMTAALGLSIKDKTKISCEKLEARSKHYIERMGLFSFLCLDSGISVTKHESAGRFIPLTEITNSKELTEFITEMIPLLHLDPSQAEPIRYVISELVRNVFEHSNSNNGAVVCAQYYKKSNTIRLGVADCGVGIKETIGVSHDVPDDLSAIRLALTPGVTGKKQIGGTDQNAGAGLFFIKSIAKVDRDFFVLYSGNSMYKLKKIPQNQKSIRLNYDPLKDRSSTSENLPYWTGTVVGIDISLDRLRTWSQLLGYIRSVYHKKTRDKSKRKYKMAKFI